MTKLELNADELLTTTRAVRKRLDFNRPVDMALIEECLQIALQAPTGSNGQSWHFVVVTDQEKKEAIARYYQLGFADYENGPVQPTMLHSDDPSMASTQQRVLDSARYLSENMAKVPALIIPCFQGRIDSPDVPAIATISMLGSIFPAIWSFMLAARERQLGSCITTLHLSYEQEIGELLGIPDGYTQVALLPIAYSIGTDFKPARRKPLDNILHINEW